MYEIIILYFFFALAILETAVPRAFSPPATHSRLFGLAAIGALFGVQITRRSALFLGIAPPDP